ncbi:hypothetical protein BIT28_07310 [Photobacterium proteolyticum]|uniref:VWFA domain-containing protein n=1 Tax=Photobacterium proteolyticum TaxID=1903952 RepID=A0A1Q9GF40_9GAMM|nr:TadE/TadG family type IV pilus assembly protein [Photobacterium proteolyticum]OLQ72976.1 hypothetical protein BIT28_07310 [Photobacterium proteolyticum]
MTSRLGRRAEFFVLSKQRGAISLTFVMLLPVMLIMLAAMTAFSMYVQSALRVSQASDAASLACAYSQRADQTVIQGLLDYYRPNFVPTALHRKSQLTIDKRCNVAAGYAFKPVLAPLMSAENNHELSSNSTAKARLITGTSINPIDFALSLDISDSMTTQIKLPRLKEIIKMAIEEVSYAASIGTVRFSMVTFQKQVGFKDAPWLPESKGKVVCVDGLPYFRPGYPGYGFDVDKTIAELGMPASSVTKRLSPPTEIAWRPTCSSSEPMLPLTSDLNLIKDRVDNFVATGRSNVFQGLYWGGRSLIPQWQRDWHIEPVTAPGLMQRLVVFTDGGIEHSHDQMIADYHVPICQAFEDKFDIEIVFVGFQIPDGNIEQIKRCAGSEDAVYNAQDEAQLEAYFRQALKVESKGMKLILEN